MFIFLCLHIFMCTCLSVVLLFCCWASKTAAAPLEPCRRKEKKHTVTCNKLVWTHFIAKPTVVHGLTAHEPYHLYHCSFPNYPKRTQSIPFMQKQSANSSIVFTPAGSLSARGPLCTLSLEGLCSGQLLCFQFASLCTGCPVASGRHFIVLAQNGLGRPSQR